MQVLEKYKEKFTADFAHNKKLLDEVAIIRSKGLKNEMAGYITKFIKRENDSKAQKELVETEQEVEQVEAQEEQETAEESMPQEIIVESASEETA
jgi:small subunit ribosomal protein S17e